VGSILIAAIVVSGALTIYFWESFNRGVVGQGCDGALVVITADQAVVLNELADRCAKSTATLFKTEPMLGRYKCEKKIATGGARRHSGAAD